MNSASGRTHPPAPKQLALYDCQPRQFPRFPSGHVRGFDSGGSFRLALYHLEPSFRFNRLRGRCSPLMVFTGRAPAVNSLYHFAVTVLSSHFHCMKDSLYADAPGSLTRRASQTTLFNVLQMYTTAIAPVACHLAEEAYECFRLITGDPKPSVFRCGWLQMGSRERCPIESTGGEVTCCVVSFRDTGFPQEATAILPWCCSEYAARYRLIGPAPEAQVILHADGVIEELLRKYGAPEFQTLAFLGCQGLFMHV
ncbi:MAG: hypothetical protein BJ554DRAFT_3915 [Olpidium bornovanus]|uniref:Methionyl/Valyl/Leucyl/Isoleucyl-tRNA synthetase anticodon-binding domain-containing protein n=1 Tax=Olpidium bornovanus TaxID=278681 RepID=A0A8H8A210_9FUNG|nr:MAG: hypothetical protein BJ554DRAFT_3915 [Olpidium bornovanus]